MRFDPLNPSIPFGDVIADFIDWTQATMGWLFDAIQAILRLVYNAFTFALATPPIG